MRALALFAAWLCCASIAWAAKAPDWLAAVMAADVTELSRNKVAVRLLDSGDVRHLPDNRVKRLTRGAVRILTENGRTLATCHYQFNADSERVLAARAWVVSADGKKVETFSQREFSDSAASYSNVFWPQQRVLRFTAANTIPLGSVFAWEFEVESQTSIADLNWAFPIGLPVHIAVLEVAPAPGARLAWHATEDESIPEPVPGAQPGALRWERRDFVTPSSLSSDRPTGFLPTTRALSVRNISPNNVASIETWADLARLAAGVIEPCMQATPDVKSKADAIVAGKATRWERIRAVAEFVQKEVTYLAVVLDKDYLAGYRPHAAGDVLKNRHGDCKDKAALFVTMLRAIGEDGNVVLVAAGNPKAIQPDWPSARFNHAIAAVPAQDAPAGWPVVNAGAQGRFVLFDATDSSTPLGVLSTGDQGGFGLIASPNSTGLIKLPIAPAAQNAAEMRVQAKLDVAGLLTVSVEEVCSGGIGALLHQARENLRNDRFTPVLEKRLRGTLSFLEELHWKDTWDPTEARWRLVYDFKAPRYARRTGGTLMLVSPCVVGEKATLNPWRTRQEGVVWRPASTQRKSVRFTLPQGAVVEDLPPATQLRTDTANGRLLYRCEGEDVLVDYELTERGGFLNQRDYEAFRAILQKLQEAERRPLLIKLEPTGAK